MSGDLARGLAHLLGWLAALALVSSLLTSLLARWAMGPRRARLVAARRLLGLAGFGLAVVHALASIGTALLPRSPAALWTMLDALAYLRHGALALALLAPLALTSFAKVNARLRLRAWGALHRLVYAASVLVALHVLAGPEADPRLALTLAVVMALLLLGRVVPVRRSAAGPGGGERADAEPSLTTGSSDSP